MSKVLAIAMNPQRITTRPEVPFSSVELFSVCQLIVSVLQPTGVVVQSQRSHHPRFHYY